jgi:hypothetical protein
VTTHSSLSYLRCLRPKADLAFVPVPEAEHIAVCRVNSKKMY